LIGRTHQSRRRGVSQAFRRLCVRISSSSSRADPRLGNSSLQKSAPSISVLRSMPGRVEANVTCLQTGLNSVVPSVWWASLLSFSFPWRVGDGSMKDTAIIYFQGSTRYMTKQAKPSGTVGLAQRWTTCATSHFCDGHVMTVMDTEDTDAGTIDQRHPPWLTLPLSLSWSLLHTKRQAGHIQSKGEKSNSKGVEEFTPNSDP